MESKIRERWEDGSTGWRRGGARNHSPETREPRNTGEDRGARSRGRNNGHQDTPSGEVDVLDVDAQRTRTSKVIHKCNERE
jgi:hypothetical protein